MSDVSVDATPLAIRDEKGRFLVGKPGGPGRPSGSRNKLSEDYFADLYALWQRRGREILERAADEAPAVVIKAIASLVPKEMLVRTQTVEEISDAELFGLIEQLRLVEGKLIEAQAGAGSGEERAASEPGEQSP